MVKSGLTERTDVSHYRLALTFNFGFYYFYFAIVELL